MEYITNFKIIEMRVRLDCQGCADKVKKLLKQVDGAYEIKLDLENEMVVVKGLADADALINKLKKHNRHAELVSERNVNTDKSAGKKPAGLKIGAAGVVRMAV